MSCVFLYFTATLEVELLCLNFIKKRKKRGGWRGDGKSKSKTKNIVKRGRDMR